MSNELTFIQQSPQQSLVPASLQGLMESQTQDDLQSGVGASFAVVSIKGKVFQIKYGGTNTPVLVNMNGAMYAAPYFDVVIPQARAPLSKTYYPGGYSDGDDAPPTCWSEDGVNPLAPLSQRPLSPAQGNQHCTDCRLCPMNVFGSKMTDDGRKAKACGDTRKLLVVPMAPSGQVDAQGNALLTMDSENVKYGGAMLLRVPAASLKPFAEYGAKLQAMGLAYYGVVTRLQFDPTQAYPKFQLAPVRTLTEAEGNEVIRIRNSAQAKQILEGSHVAGAPEPAAAGPDALPPPMAAQATQVPAQPAPAPAQAVPVQQAAPAAAMPYQPAPAPEIQQLPPQAPVQAYQPAPVVQQAPAPLPHPPQAPAQTTTRTLEVLGGRTRADWDAAGWKDDEQLVQGGHARWVDSLPPPPPSNGLPPPPPINAAQVAAAPSQTAAPVNVTAGLLDKVDSLLNS